MMIRALALAAALVLTGATPVAAGSGAAPITPFAVEDAADFSKQIERDLAARGARVALVFRSGRTRDALPPGIRYTHGALWVHSELQTVDGRRLHGYAVHNLYRGESDPRTSYLLQDWPLNFTQGDVIGEVGVIIPTPEMQTRLAALLAGGTHIDLHEPAYSLLSNPHDARFQNCNEYLLDLVAAAAWQTTDRRQIKANLTAWFEPSTVQTRPLERLLAPMLEASIRLDDQGSTIRTTTFNSLAAFMEHHGLSDASYEITADFLSGPAAQPQAGPWRRAAPSGPGPRPPG